MISESLSIEGRGGHMSFLRRLLGIDAKSCIDKARRYEQMGKLGMARMECEKAAELIEYHDAVSQEELKALLSEISAKEQENTEGRVQEALKAGDFKMARYYLNIAISKAEEGSSAYNDLLIQRNSIPEDSEEAAVEDELQTLLRSEPGVSFVDRQRTLEFWKSGFPPYKEDYYFNKALTSEVLRAESEKVLKNPDDADACFNFGITLAQLGLIDKALDQLKRFVVIKPEDRDGHYFLANLLADEGYDDEAIREFERTIALDPAFLEAYLYLAKHYENLGDLESARKLYEHLLSQQPENDLAEEARNRLETIGKEDEPLKEAHAS
jgi:tetratricopeptide (TPR) repeat protein